MDKPDTLPRPYKRAEELVDAAVHVVGVFGALLAVPVLVTLAVIWRGEPSVITAVTIYGVTLFAMLLFSASYNMASVRWKGGPLVDWLRRLDHATIYVKIAGTYTPYAVITGGPLGRWLLLGVWSAAAVGFLGKIIAPGRLERLSVLLYLALGWCVVLVYGPVSASVTATTSVLILIGGALYSVGVVFHLWERLPFQNAIWHIFVLIATFVFYSAMVVEMATGT